MALPMIQIPGNTKQKYMPFVINPNAKIHSSKFQSSSQLANGAASPQLFSYNNIDVGSYHADAKAAKLNFFPSSVTNISIQDDISYKMLYPMDATSNKMYRTDLIRLDDILNHIPGISIREFIPDTRLDQCINFFLDFFKGTSEMMKQASETASSSGKSDTGDTNAIALIGKKLLACAEYTIMYLTGLSDPNLYNDFILSRDLNLPLNAYDPKMVGSLDKNNKAAYYILTFPYVLYYRLQSCVTTNIYKVPAADSKKNVISSTGSSGWGEGSDFMGAGGMRMSGLLGKIPVIGEIANMVLGNIGVNYMPWWDAQSGAKTKEPTVEITFDLYNDSAEAAMNNFLFVNTIAPNNRWMQYNMFQHSSSLYDIKIEGLNRLFACRGDVSISYDGVLRDPPYSWIHKLVSEHANNCMVKDKFENFILMNRIIKIPDIYKVSLTFDSLLPANFNNYLYMYSENRNHITEYENSIYQPTIGYAFGGALGKFMGHLSAVWSTGELTAATTQESIDAITKAVDDAKKATENAIAKAKAAVTPSAAEATTSSEPDSGDEDLGDPNLDENGDYPDQNEIDNSGVEGSDDFNAANESTTDPDVVDNEAEYSRTMEGESGPDEPSIDQPNDVDSAPTEDDLIADQENQGPGEPNSGNDPDDVGPDSGDPEFNGSDDPGSGNESNPGYTDQEIQDGRESYGRDD